MGYSVSYETYICTMTVKSSSCSLQTWFDGNSKEIQDEALEVSIISTKLNSLAGSLISTHDFQVPHNYSILHFTNLVVVTMGSL